MHFKVPEISDELEFRETNRNFSDTIICKIPIAFLETCFISCSTGCGLVLLKIKYRATCIGTKGQVYKLHESAKVYNDKSDLFVYRQFLVENISIFTLNKLCYFLCFQFFM